jgi:hypothetical protein
MYFLLQLTKFTMIQKKQTRQLQNTYSSKYKTMFMLHKNITALKSVTITISYLRVKLICSTTPCFRLLNSLGSFDSKLKLKYTVCPPSIWMMDLSLKSYKLSPLQEDNSIACN